MKTLIATLTFAALCFNSTSVLAHADHANAKINSGQAKTIALNVSKKLSLKDLGYSVGKLDKSWRQLNEKNATVLPTEHGKQRVLLENKEKKKHIIVTLSPAGTVLSVKEKSSSTEKDHDKAHENGKAHNH